MLEVTGRTPAAATDPAKERRLRTGNLYPDNALRPRRGIVMNFRVQFLDASAAVVRETLVKARRVGLAIALYDGMEWPPDVVRMVILDAKGREVHSEERRSPRVGR